MNMDSHWHPLAGGGSSHGDLGKTDLGTKPKAQEPIFHSADGEPQVQHRYQNTVAEIDKISQLYSDCFLVSLKDCPTA